MNCSPGARQHAMGWLIGTGLGVAVTLAGRAAAQTGTAVDPPLGTVPVALADDGPAYPISKINIRFLHQGHRQHPKRDRIMRLEVDLGRTPEGYVAPRDGETSVSLRLADLEERGVEMYHASALQAILVRIYDFLIDRDLLGVFVAPDPEQISPTGQDLRPEGRTALRIVITTSIATEVRTLGTGERVDPAQRVNHPKHARIIEHSPVRPFDAETGDPKERRDLLRRDAIDDYVYWLSRHPGRRVDAALSAGDETGAVTLDYLVTENKPLILYTQLSNTGTDSTDKLRQRFGLIHTQLAGFDDVLSIDYSTASFDEVNSVVASYEGPLPWSDRWRWRVEASWSEYTASELGLFADVFTGDSWSAGGELIWNVHQRRNLFVDVFFGWRKDHITANNRVIDVTGEEDFELAHVGVRFEKQSRWYSLLGTVSAEWNDGQDPQPDVGEMTRLGRLFPDPNFGILRWDLAAATYLEPLLDRAAWEDPTTPASSTLAHEIAVSFRGQYAFDNRLIPQYQQVLGGLYSVRGYPQSLVAGDSVIIGSLEYRFHLPRALAILPEPAELFGQPFRVAPQAVYGRPDWDLVLRGFVDAGSTFITDQLFFEEEVTLVGAGVGLEIQYRNNVSARVDWGFALHEVRDVSRGSNRVHFVASFFF